MEKAKNKREFHYCPICGKELCLSFIEGRNRKNCVYCGFVDYKNPLPCVSIVGFKKNKIVLIKRGIEPSKGEWALPSGFMEVGESPEEAALREFYEETSLRGRIVDLLGVYSQKIEIYGDLVIITFLVEVTGGKAKARDDAIDVDFFSWDELPELKQEIYRDAIRIAKHILENF
ncbi:MAG: NUDIX hydrolase [candidate division WOR-3 bacterium]